jgi:hypothetical protein
MQWGQREKRKAHQKNESSMNDVCKFWEAYKGIKIANEIKTTETI